jgi:hypothetical protein
VAGVVAAAAVAETRVNRAAARDAHHVASEWIRRVRERRVTGEPAVMRFRKAWETSQRRPGRSGGGGLVVRVVRSALMSSGGAEQQSEGCERGQLQLVHCMRVSTVVDAATSLGGTQLDSGVGTAGTYIDLPRTASRPCRITEGIERAQRA